FFLKQSPPSSTLFPYTTLFRSCCLAHEVFKVAAPEVGEDHVRPCCGQARDLGLEGCCAQLGIEFGNNFRIRLEGLECGLEDVCRSEEHTSELQSRENLVCRLLL